jgi:hypothetical protein
MGREIGRYGIYFAPWACGRPGGLWLDGFDTVDEAMDAADRYVAGYLAQRRRLPLLAKGRCGRPDRHP